MPFLIHLEHGRPQMSSQPTTHGFNSISAMPSCSDGGRCRERFYRIARDARVPYIIIVASSSPRVVFPTLRMHMFVCVCMCVSVFTCTVELLSHLITLTHWMVAAIHHREKMLKNGNMHINILRTCAQRHDNKKTRCSRKN